MKTGIKFLSTLFLTGILMVTSCKKEDTGPKDEDTLTTSDTAISIVEYSDSGTVLAKLSASSIKGDVAYVLKETVPTSTAFAVLTDGTVYVSNKKALKYIAHNSVVVKVNVTNDVFTKVLNVTVNLTPTDVQNRMNNGETPSEIYTNDNTFLDSLDGKSFQFGYIIHFDKDKKETLLADTGTFMGDFIWGCKDTFLATSSAIGEGEKNTSIISANCSLSKMASKKCEASVNGGYTNWYLPSLDELQLIYDKLYLKGIGSFNESKYWSSTDKNKSIAQMVSFNTGSTTFDDKETGSGKVYAIRTYKE